MSAPRNGRARAGFTLIELMVALVAGSFVISGAYYLSDVSARLFNEQMRRAETQMTLRTASEQLRRDIGRAGFLGARDTAELWGCNSVQGDLSVSPTRQQAVRVVPAPGGGVMLFLTGNFTTGDQYPLDISSDSNQLTLSPTREGFRRSFSDPESTADYPTSFLQQRFLSAFAPNTTAPNTAQGRMLAVQDLSTGRIFLTNIVGLNELGPVGPQIFINPPLPAVGGCITSPTALVVSPLSTIRYMVENPAGNAELGRAAQAANALAGGARFVLTRTEINMTTNGAANPTPIANTARIVLDFVADVNSFRIAGYFDRNAVIGAPPLPPAIAYTATPEVMQPVQLRTLLIDLVGGSAEVTAAAGPANERQSRVQAGRRLAHLEVFMPNMARNPGVR